MKLIDGEQACQAIMKYAKDLHNAGNGDAAGYVMWAAEKVKQCPSAISLDGKTVPMELYRQILWEEM